MLITKKIEFDAGHRIPSHNSKCRHPHGHRYVIQVTLKGDIKPCRGQSDDGMVLDFSDIKRIVTEKIHDAWDHAFLVYEKDTPMKRALALLVAGDPAVHRIVELPCIPTAENLSELAFTILDGEFKKVYGDMLMLYRVRLYETPTSWADAFRDSIKET